MSFSLSYLLSRLQARHEKDPCLLQAYKKSIIKMLGNIMPEQNSGFMLMSTLDSRRPH